MSELNLIKDYEVFAGKPPVGNLLKLFEAMQPIIDGEYQAGYADGVKSCKEGAE